ncbi:hypothetical protein F4823DRAFT_613928 [Ustulina deusta]|nr:hypothetical protein F4823DRAFT_613928 [Ustulina deusta]
MDNSFQKLPPQLIVMILKLSNNSADIFSLILTCRQIRNAFLRSRLQILDEVGQECLKKVPEYLERYALFAHMLSVLAVYRRRQPCRPPRLRSVWAILKASSQHRLRRPEPPGGHEEIICKADMGFLYATVLPFIEDYAQKAEAFIGQQDPLIYNKAPSWAHSSLPCCSPVTDQLLGLSRSSLVRMQVAFFHFQIFCEMHNALRGEELIDFFIHNKVQHECYQETVLHDYCRTLLPIELDEFRSVLWYVSTLWAILLDEVKDDKSDWGFHSRASILCYVCASGLPVLRTILWSPPELRRRLVLNILKTMPTPKLFPQTLHFSHSRRPFKPLDARECMGLPILARTADSPISFTLQMDMRAQAWVFRSRDDVEYRCRLTGWGFCCELQFSARCDTWEMVDSSRWLNSSPSCYGGWHKAFCHY